MNLNILKYGKGYPLVFFHGWGFDSRIWLPLIPLLESEFQIFLVDLPGFGTSPIISWNEFSTNVLNQLPARFALIGWSMGGLYATRLALEHTEKIEYLINVTSSPRFLMDHLWAGVSQQVFHRFYKKLVNNPYHTLKEFLELQGVENDEIEVYLPSELPSTEGLKEGLNVLATWDLRDSLKQYSKSSSFMFGRFDPIVPQKTMQCMQVDYPYFRYDFFDHAAHMPFLSHSSLFISKIKEIIFT